MGTTQITEELKDLMNLFPCIHLTPVLDAEPADEASTSNLNKFKQYQLQKSRHRDKSISATFHHKILRGDKDVEDLVVHREGFDVPSSWLGKRYYLLVIILLITGLSAFAILPLLLKVNKKKVTFKKKIEYKEAY